MPDLATTMRKAAEFIRHASAHPEILEKKSALKRDAGTAAAKAAADRFKGAQDQFRRNLRGHLDGLLGGKISGEQALERMTAEVRKAYRTAYVTGKETVLGVKATLDANDQFFLRRAAEEESRFLRRFLGDVTSSGGKAAAGKMEFSRRLDMYADGLKGPHENARVEYMDDGVAIFWNLGPAEHCEDCLALSSMNPWTKENLPCTPASGDTACLSRCACSLWYEIVKVKRQDQPTRPGKMSHLWSLPKPPKGLTLPSAEQRLTIEATRQEMNYWRREAQDAAAAGDDVAEAEALRMRTKVNQELIDYQKGTKTWSPPGLSVDEVLGGRILDEQLAGELIALGFDGQTMAGMKGATFRDVADKIMKDSAVVDIRVARALKGAE